MTDLAHLPKPAAGPNATDIVARERSRIASELAHPAPWYGRYIRLLVGEYRPPSYIVAIWHIFQLVPITIVAFLLLNFLPGLDEERARRFGDTIRAAPGILAVTYIYAGIALIKGTIRFKPRLFLSAILHLVPPLGLVAQIPQIYARFRYGSRLKDPKWTEKKLRELAKKSDATILREACFRQIEAAWEAILIGAEKSGSMDEARRRLEKCLREAKDLERRIDDRLRRASPEHRQALKKGLDAAKARVEKIQAAYDRHMKALQAAEAILRRCQESIDRIDGVQDDAELLEELDERSTEDDDVLNHAAFTAEAAVRHLRCQLLNLDHAHAFTWASDAAEMKAPSSDPSRERPSPQAPDP